MLKQIEATGLRGARSGQAGLVASKGSGEAGSDSVRAEQ
jgi:hypothetical protein